MISETSPKQILPSKSKYTPETKSKKNSNRIGIWSNQQINERIEQLSKELDSQVPLSISRKKRIKERLNTLKKGLSGSTIIGGQVLKKKKSLRTRKTSSTSKNGQLYDKEVSKKPHKSIKCLQCRRGGHLLKDCPLNQENLNSIGKRSVDATYGFCFNCGEKNHTLKNCPKARPQDGSLSFAVCFLCKQKGHLAINCSLNSKGMFPNGGGCRICGSIYHKQSECPEKRKFDKKHPPPKNSNKKGKLDDPDEYWLDKV